MGAINLYVVHVGVVGVESYYVQVWKGGCNPLAQFSGYDLGLLLEAVAEFIEDREKGMEDNHVGNA